MAASVVDLPEPVGPVTSTRPFMRFVKSVAIFGSPSFSSARISNGICRITIDTTPRCRNTLPRNRDSPLIPNEKSSSFVDSKRLRCSSDITLYASWAVTSGVSTSYSLGVIEPSIRNSGGTPAVMCRSDDFL